MAKDPAIGGRIRQVRDNLGLSQKELGERLGVTRVSVARYEAGKIPRLDILNKLARVADVTVGWLLQGEGRTPSQLGRSANTKIPPSLRGPLSRLASELANLETFSPHDRRLYAKRLKEVTIRMLRELEEYRAVLRAKRKRG